MGLKYILRNNSISEKEGIPASAQLIAIAASDFMNPFNTIIRNTQYRPQPCDFADLFLSDQEVRVLNVEMKAPEMGSNLP
jgi:hypothetical protein